MSVPSAVASMNLPGGIPDHQDLVPTIVFLILYVFTSAFLLFTWSRNTLGRVFMIRPTLFFVARVAFFVIRLVCIEHGLTEGLLIADLVAVLVGFIFLLDPAISLWKRQEVRKYTGQKHPRLLTLSTIVLKGLLFAAIGTGAAAGALIAKALNNPDTMRTVTICRKISYILSLVVIASIILLNVYALLTRRWASSWGVNALSMTYLLSLMIVAVYRIVNGETHNAQAFVRSKTAFWILQIAVEWVAALMLLLLINLIARTESPIEEPDHPPIELSSYDKLAI